MPLNGLFDELVHLANDLVDDLIHAEPDDMLLETNVDEKTYRYNARIFLAISILSALLILGFEIYMFAVINLYKTSIVLKSKYGEISIYLALFIFSGLYQIVLTVVGLRTKNMLLLAMLCAFYVAMLIYTGIQYEEVSTVFTHALGFKWRRSVKGTNIAAIVVLGITLITQVALLWFVLRKNVKWFRFKKIGADLKIRRMYSIFQLHRALLIFDFYFFIGFTVQFIVIMIKNKSSVEFILTVCVLPLTLILLFLSDLATTREKLYLTICTLLSFCGGFAYVIFKMIRLYTKYSSAFDIGIKPGSYFPGRKSLMTFGVITLVLLVTTVLFEVLVLLNYGKGLLPLVNTYYKWIPGHRKNNDEEPEKVFDESSLID